MFDIFGVPVMGHEEDAADNFASYIMLQFGKERARRLIGGAAWAYKAYISDYQPTAKCSSNSRASPATTANRRNASIT